MGKLERCDPGFRLCIRVNKTAGSFESQGYDDYCVIEGF